MIVDLGSGLGGASEAFVNDYSWIVKRFDNSDLVEHVPFTIKADYVEQTQDIIDYIHVTKIEENIDEILIWASPECKEWSNGYSSRKSTMKRNGLIFVPDMTQLRAITQIINAINPEYYIIENVLGGVNYINTVFGDPKLIYRPWFFWGKFPQFRIDENRKHKTIKDPHSSNPLRYHIRSKIPIGISLSLKNAIENQKSLLEWVE